MSRAAIMLLFCAKLSGGIQKYANFRGKDAKTLDNYEISMSVVQ